MDRIQLSFPPKMLGWLRKEAKNKGISIAEFVRRILDEWYEKKKKEETE